MKGVKGGSTVRKVSRQYLIAGKRQPCTLRFPSFLPHRFPGWVSYWFYKVLELSGASGRGLKYSSLSRLILDDFGVHFGAHLGSILELIFEGIEMRVHLTS